MTFENELKVPNLKLRKIWKTAMKSESIKPVSLMGQLMWREFCHCAAAAEPNFDKMVENKICRQIPRRYNEDSLNAMGTWKDRLSIYRSTKWFKIRIRET